MRFATLSLIIVEAAFLLCFQTARANICEDAFRGNTINAAAGRHASVIAQLKKTPLYDRMIMITKATKGLTNDEKQIAYIQEYSLHMQMSLQKLSNIGADLTKTAGLEIQKLEPVILSLPRSNESTGPFYETLHSQKPGGAWVGLGHEQNYDGMATARVANAKLFDVDPRAIVAHLIVEAAFHHAKTPKEFKAFFDPNNTFSTHEKIAEYYGDENIGTFYGATAIRFYSSFENSGFVQNPEMYKTVRELFVNNKVELFLGETGSDVLSRIAASVRADGSYVKNFYLSNALEPRWTPTFTSSFQKGLLALPVTADSKLLTTWTDPKTDTARIGVIADGPYALQSTGGWVRFSYFASPLKEGIAAMAKSSQT